MKDSIALTPDEIDIMNRAREDPSTIWANLGERILSQGGDHPEEVFVEWEEVDSSLLDGPNTNYVNDFYAEIRRIKRERFVIPR